MGNGLIRSDLTLGKYFTYGYSDQVITKRVLPRRKNQPILMRGEVGIRDGGHLRPLVAHNTTHIDMPIHFIDGGADLDAVLNNPDYRINGPMLTRILDLSHLPAPGLMHARDGVRYCELVCEEMLPPFEELRQFDALLLLTGFGAILDRGSEGFHPDADGYYHLPGITAGVARRVAEAGISLLGIDCLTVERQTGGNPMQMSSDVHPILLGNDPPVFILEGISGARIVPQTGFMPSEGVLEVIPRRANAAGADAAHARVFLSFFHSDSNNTFTRQRLQQLIELTTPDFLVG